jgi:GntR family transcriptional regulator
MSDPRRGALRRPMSTLRGVDPESKLPLYHQIYRILHGKIMRGEWKADFMIPPESELIHEYRVSRITIRAVLNKLADEGLIRRERGRGTFVSPLRLEHGLTHIISFTEDMRTRGFEAHTKMIAARLVPAPADIAEKLGIEKGEELVHLERLRLAGDTPMCVESSRLVHRYCPGILKYDFAQHSLREVKARDYGIRWAQARQTIQAIMPSPKLARLLKISRAVPLIFIERISYSQHNLPVEFLQAYYRADLYTLHGELKGGA